MLLYSDITYDNRVLREARTLADAGFDVTIVCPSAPRRPLAEVDASLRVVVRAPTETAALPGGAKPRAGGARASVGWAIDYGRGLRRWGAAARREFGATTDIWHVHDLTGLVALAAGGGRPPPRVIYDSHELYLESGAMRSLPWPVSRALRAYEGRLARRAAAVITVNDGVARELEQRYGVAPAVVMNCPPRPDEAAVAGSAARSDVPGVPGVLRRHFGLGERPVALYHGALSPQRGIDAFLGAMDLLPRDLAMVVIGEGMLADHVRERAAEPALRDRFYWHPMIVPSELRSWLTDADIGLVLLEPDRLNHFLATPNRLFEAINAGLPILASDLPELRRIVDLTGAGTVCDPMSPGSIAAGVARLLDPATAREMRARGLAAASGAFNWETQSQALLGVYHDVSALP